ncbi:4Fe-4S dicluster domain-containing protein [Bacillota bacterium LX-D]|nr:4Fe-4S dicluster domain-containing protein [Bacillota bacterium LX-D]
MEKIYVNEDRCIGCHLCEYYCAFAHSGKTDMVKAFAAGQKPSPRLVIEEQDNISFAVSCRHCTDPLCVKSCLTGAMEINEEGKVFVDETRCVGCNTCILVCPYGAILPGDGKVVKKCDLCTSFGKPICAEKCPNLAIVYEERGEV